MLAIDIKRVVKTFGSGRTKITAVNNISLQINKGEIFGLLGVNGAGKSTLTNILSGLTYADSGTIKIFGLDFYEHEEEIKSRSNVATAYYDLNHSLTVMENLKIYAQLYGVKNYKEKIYALADKFLLTPYLNTITRKLSSGERIRAVLIKALLNDPELLFLDECTVGLDPDMAEIVRDYIQKYNQETGCTILFTSHYMQEVERLCKRIAFMDNGRIIKVAPAKELVGELELQTVIMHFSKNIEEAKKLLQKEKISFYEEQNNLMFYVKNKTRILYPLLKKFVQKNIVFDDLHLNKPTLEEYFIRKKKKRSK